MGFNLSAWALRNRQIVLFLMILLAAIGAMGVVQFTRACARDRDDLVRMAGTNLGPRR